MLRRAAGAAVLLADGHGWHAPATLRGEHARVSAPPTCAPRRSPAIEVVQALPKGRKLDDVVRTLTELGVDRIRPVLAERCVAALHGARAEQATQRWQAVVWAASEQSRRVWRPVVDPPRLLVEVLGEVARLPGAALLAHPGADPLRAVLERVATRERLTLAVGPEGGWSDGEVAVAKEHGMAVVTLGSQVLRTEHAAAALAAIVGYRTGRIG